MDLKYIIAQQRRRPRSPSLDLSFALDESTTSRRGQNLTFTRTSSGTFVNKNGRIVGKTTSTTSYNTANVMINDIITFTVPSGSVVGWLDGAEVVAHNDANADNLVPGSNTTEALIRGTIIHKGETSISLQVFAKGGPDATPAAWSISYRGPRLDYNPVTGACRGLLIEESRQNKSTYSDARNSIIFSNPQSVTIDYNITGVNAPDETTGLTRFRNIVNAGSRIDINFYGSIGYVYSNALVTGTTYKIIHASNSNWTSVGASANTSGTIFTASGNTAGNGFALPQSVYSASYCLSFFIKNENGYAPTTLSMEGGWGTNLYGVYTFDTGQKTITLYTNGGHITPIGGYIEYPAGWLRVWVISPGDRFANRVYIGNYGASTVQNSFYLWGLQYEVGSFPTSYIPTTTGPATRSADVCSITGADFANFYNQSAGTFYVESRPQTVDGTTTVFGVSDGTTNERWLNRFAQNEQVVVNASGIESKFDPLNPVAGTLYKVATAATLNDIAVSINGSAALTDNSQPMPTVNQATIGGVSSTVATIRYYPYRLPNAKQEELTATTTQQLTYNGVPLLFNNTDIDITI
jgi:hypothetical protein